MNLLSYLAPSRVPLALRTGPVALPEAPQVGMSHPQAPQWQCTGYGWEAHEGPASISGKVRWRGPLEGRKGVDWEWPEFVEVEQDFIAPRGDAAPPSVKITTITPASASALIAQRGFTGHVFIDEWDDAEGFQTRCGRCGKPLLAGGCDACWQAVQPAVKPDWRATPFYRQDLKQGLAAEVNERLPQFIEELTRSVPDGCSLKLIERHQRLYFFATPDGLTFPWRFDGVSWVANEPAPPEDE